MSQDRLIKLVSQGVTKNDATEATPEGMGKGHVIYTVFNNKNKKDPSKKYEVKKFNPVAKKHTLYKQKSK
jgi:ribosomal protein L33